MYSDDFKKILIILIGSGKKPLASYSQYLSKDFVSITETMLKGNKITKELKIIKQDEMHIYSQEVNNISYIVLTTDKFALTAGAGCIESLINEIGPLLQGRNFNKIKDYGLNDELKEKLKMKYDYYNENTQVTSEALERLKIELNKMKDEVFKANEELMKRNDKLQEMEVKANEMAEESETYKKNAFKVVKTESKRKIWVYVGIFFAVLIIGYAIVCIACNSFTFECGSQ